MCCSHVFLSLAMYTKLIMGEVTTTRMWLLCSVFSSNEAKRERRGCWYDCKCCGRLQLQLFLTLSSSARAPGSSIKFSGSWWLELSLLLASAQNRLFFSVLAFLLWKICLSPLCKLSLGSYLPSASCFLFTRKKALYWLYHVCGEEEPERVAQTEPK